MTTAFNNNNIESRKRTIIARAKQNKQTWHYYNGYEVRVRKAYTNGSSDPKDWTYCVSWYADGQLVECENGVRLEQAARALNDLPRWAETYKAAEIAAAEGIKVGGFVKINTDGRTAIVKGIGLVSEGHGVMLYMDDFTNWCKDCREKNGYNIITTSDEVTPLTEDDYKPQTDIKDDYKVGDRVRHNQSGRVATIEGMRVTREMKAYGEYRKVYRLNFGESVPGPFGYDLNGGEFLAEAITPYKTA